jgi:HAD superfamily hydrolase (TIGR01484 family)
VRYFALATDYDGTIARHGRVDAAALQSLERVRASGRRLILVTGRHLDDLVQVFPEAPLFDRIVAENGALLYDPATRVQTPLAEPPPPEFLQELTRRGVSNLSAGRVIVSTWEPNEITVFETIRDLALELQVVFNKGAVMVLPTGINKATGLRAALDELRISFHNTVGAGDAENDQAFLAACECGVAVANALESVKAKADWVTTGDHSAGIIELIDRLVTSDLKELASRLSRHEILIGHAVNGQEVRMPPFGGGMLVAGPSGSGKSRVTTSFLEQLAAAHYQCCIVDPEGDYGELPGAVALASSETRSLLDDTLEVLEPPEQSVIVNLLNIALEERPHLFGALLPRLQTLRAATGRPHWIAIDEAHHLMPADWAPAPTALPGEFVNLLLVTVHPDHVAPAALGLVQTLVIVGRDASATLAGFARGANASTWQLPSALDDLPPGEAWLLTKHRAPALPALSERERVEGSERSESNGPIRFTMLRPEGDRQRHRRKYAEGQLGTDKSFYFRGPEGRLNLRAQNLQLFTQLAEGVDDETWLHHLRQQDYSRWFRDAIKDEALATEAATVERQSDLTAAESRARIRAAIESRYTAAP